MVYSTAHPATGPVNDGRRHWPDSVFRIALITWLILGLASIVRMMMLGRPAVSYVLLVAWGLIVIVVLWVRMGPPREPSNRLLR